MTRKNRTLLGLDPAVHVRPEDLAGMRGQKVSEPVRALMAAVLEDAICVRARLREHLRRRPDTRLGETLLYETERWFRSEDRRWLFSFRNVCEVLGLDRAAVREAVLRTPPARRLAA